LSLRLGAGKRGRHEMTCAAQWHEKQSPAPESIAFREDQGLI
jgi:hypothetical protein